MSASGLARLGRRGRARFGAPAAEAPGWKAGGDASSGWQTGRGTLMTAYVDDNQSIPALAVQFGVVPRRCTTGLSPPVGPVAPARSRPAVTSPTMRSGGSTAMSIAAVARSAICWAAARVLCTSVSPGSASSVAPCRHRSPPLGSPARPGCPKRVRRAVPGRLVGARHRIPLGLFVGDRVPPPRGCRHGSTTRDLARLARRASQPSPHGRGGHPPCVSRAGYGVSRTGAGRSPSRSLRSGLAPAPCCSTPGLTTWTSTHQPRLLSIATDRRRG